MKKNLILASIFFTIFLDFFSLGLIYPLFTTMVFEGGLISIDSSDFYKNSLFGLLIASFPFGQFLGAPIIGYLSDQYGRRKLLIFSLIGATITLLICGLGVFLSNNPLLLLGRFCGGLMAGNMTLAYAALADFSSKEEKVRNFALVPLATGLGFSFGPYLAGLLANPDTHALAGPVLPFLFAALLTVVNLGLVLWKFPETSLNRQSGEKLIDSCIQSFTRIGSAFQQHTLRPYLWILFLMISANFVFVQFVGPLAIDRFDFSVTEIGFLYANIGMSVALGHMFLTRRLSKYSSEQALKGSLIALATLLFIILFVNQPFALHLVTFLVMLACAVAYTNAMTLVSNQAKPEQQGQIMGVAVSIQSCAEFLPAAILSLFAFISQMIPLFMAGIFAGSAFLILIALMKKVPREASG